MNNTNTGDWFTLLFLFLFAIFLTFLGTANSVRKNERFRNSCEKDRIKKDYDEKINALENRNDILCKDIKNLKDSLYNEKKLLISQNRKLEQKLSIIKDIHNEDNIKYPWFSNLISEYEYEEDRRISRQLEHKKRPALKAAQAVSEISAEKRLLIKQNKMYAHQFLVLTSLFPWIEDFVTLDIDSAIQAVTETESSDEYSSMKKWLSPEEYNSLTTVQKYQLALDRWNSRKKSDWEIGIDYERYIGYLYESQGYSVTYTGAIQGLSDMGRDLIAIKGDECLIIQCKRWAKEKTIHEKHIFQLYGSTILKQIEEPSKKYVGVFVTTTSLSPTAQKCAEILGIQVIENKPLAPYPLIKCNISRSKEKIYHLPFDQQYDRTKIQLGSKDFYCATVAEAEAQGYRHAFKWIPEK